LFRSTSTSSIGCSRTLTSSTRAVLVLVAVVLLALRVLAVPWAVLLQAVVLSLVTVVYRSVRLCVCLAVCSSVCLSVCLSLDCKSMMLDFDVQYWLHFP
jgi:hypothetical protein